MLSQERVDASVLLSSHDAVETWGALLVALDVPLFAVLTTIPGFAVSFSAGLVGRHCVAMATTCRV